MLADYPDLRFVGPEQRWDEGRFVINKGFSYIPQIYLNYIFLYKNSTCSDAFLPDEILKESLDTLINTYYPPMTGWFETTDDIISVVWNKKDKILPSFTSTTIDVGYPKLLEMTETYSSILLTDSPLSLKVDEALRVPLLFVKVTRAKDNSGLALCISPTHRMMDGGSFCRFLNNWAYICKQMLGGTPSNKTSVLYPPIFGSLELDRGLDTNTEYHEHNEFIRVSQEYLGQNSELESAVVNNVVHTFLVSTQQKADMRKKAYSIKVSFNSIICAVIWKETSILRLSCTPEAANEPTSFSLNVDIRRRLGIPGEYCSSEVYIPYIEGYTIEQIANMELESVAKILDDFVKSVTPRDINGAFHKLWLMEKEIRQEAKDGKLPDIILSSSVIPGPFNLSSTSNDNFPMYKADFGTGIPSYSHPSIAPFDGSYIIWPSPPDDSGEGGIELYLILSKSIRVSESKELRKFIHKQFAINF